MQTIQEVMNINVLELFEPSVRFANCMKNMGVETLADLTRLTLDEINRTRIWSSYPLKLIQSKLAEMELSFGMDDKRWVDWGLQHQELIKKL